MTALRRLWPLNTLWPFRPFRPLDPFWPFYAFRTLHQLGPFDPIYGLYLRGSVNCGGAGGGRIALDFGFMSRFETQLVAPQTIASFLQSLVIGLLFKIPTYTVDGAHDWCRIPTRIRCKYRRRAQHNQHRQYAVYTNHRFAPH